MGFQRNEIEFSTETQFQILGNTPIYSLYQYTQDKVWNQFDFTTKTWGTAAVAPVNAEYEELKEDINEYYGAGLFSDVIHSRLFNYIVDMNGYAYWDGGLFCCKGNCLRRYINLF